MLVLASPFFALRLGLSDAGNDPAATTTRKAYDLLAAGLRPRLQRSAAARGADRLDRPTRRRSQRLEGALAKQPGVAAVVPFPAEPGAKVAIVEVIPDHVAAGRARPAS